MQSHFTFVLVRVTFLMYIHINFFITRFLNDQVTINQKTEIILVK